MHYVAELRIEFDAPDPADANAFADTVIEAAHAAGATVVDEVHRVAA